MRFDNNPILAGYLKDGGYEELSRSAGFALDWEEFKKVLAELRDQHPELSSNERVARAAYRLLARPKPKQAAPVIHEEPKGEAPGLKTWATPVWMALKVAWAIAVLLLLAAIAARAQQDAPIIRLKNQGSNLAIIPAGIVNFNCSTNMTCTWNSGTRQFDMTASSTAGTAWSSLTAPSADLSMSHVNFHTAFTWGAATGATDLFSLADSTGNTGTGYVFSVNTAGSSAAKPVRFAAGGAANGVEMDATGLLKKLGSGGIDATKVRSFAWSTTAPTDGKIPIFNGATSTWEPGDPIVSGPDAEGVAPTKNPIFAAVKDGGGLIRVPLAVNTAPAGTEYGLVVRNIPSGTQGVSGTVTANAGTGTFNTDPIDRTARVLGRAFLRNPGDTANMGDATNPVRVDPTGTTSQPVSGTVTGNQGAAAGQASRWPVCLSDGTACGPAGTAAAPLRVDPTGTTAQPVSQATAANLNVRPDDGGATGAAVPVRAVYAATNSSGNLTGLIACDKSVSISTATSGSTQLVALVSGQIIYVCGYNFMANGAVNVKLLYGTGVACATGPTDLTGAYNLTAQTGVAYGNGVGTVTRTAASNALCVNLSAAIQVSGIVTYTQF